MQNLTAKDYANQSFGDGVIRNLRAALVQQREGFAPDVLEFIYGQKLLRVGLPDFAQNQPLNPYQIAKVFEALAYIDGSLGWAVNLGAGANMFLGYFEPTVATELGQNPKFWIAGSGAAGGKAVKTEGGYVVSGDWKYASGSNYATHFSMNVFLHDEAGEPILNQDEQPVFRSFLVPAEQVEIVNSWHTLGLHNSCSNDFSIEQVFVPEQMMFDLTKPSEFADHGLYRYPFWSFAVANIAVMVTGIGEHFVELFSENVLPKQPELTNMIKRLQATVAHTRKEMFAAIAELNEAVEAKQTDTADLELQVKNSAKRTVDQAYKLVTELYRFCGMHTVYNANPLNKVARDFFTATQHFAIRPEI